MPYEDEIGFLEWLQQACEKASVPRVDVIVRQKHSDTVVDSTEYPFLADGWDLGQVIAILRLQQLVEQAGGTINITLPPPGGGE